ncbi:MAG TPA: DUF87 domain-containing protein [Candidatus Portnoybacteria bacterium]|nr:DUF87 domain-containing protein [Candidatus Portnoybacteria bacterium]
MENNIKNLIAPSAIKINSNSIQIGEYLARTIFVISYPKYLSTNWFSPIITLDQEFNVSLFISPLKTPDILKKLKKKSAEIQAQMMDAEEKGNTRDPKMEEALNNVETLRNNLQTGTEKLFDFGLYITFWGNDEKDLNKVQNEIESILNQQMIYTKVAVFQQEQGFNSTLPIDHDDLSLTSPMNTQSISSLFPFVSVSLTDKEGALYGINRHNNSLIILDRFRMPNANSVIFGKSGGGKSYAAKLEILRSLMLGTDVIVIDPENEYQYLAETIGGSYVKVSLSAPHRINPFDLPKKIRGTSSSDILRSNVAYLSGLVRMMVGGLSPEEDSILDKAIIETYASKNILLGQENTELPPPVLSDLQTVLESMDGGKSIAIRIKKYTEGSYAGVFNQPTNINLDNQLVVFCIRDLEEELRPLAMYVILHYIWNIVRGELKKRILMVDEAWVMMKHEDAAAFLFGIAKRCRKYYLGLTTITQDVTDFINSKYGYPILSNSSIQILFRQSPSSAEVLQKTFNLTDQEKYLLLETSVGEGILFAGLEHVAIKVVASYTEDQIVTSNPAQILMREEMKESKDSN